MLITERRIMIFNPAHPGQVLRDYLGEMTVGEAASRLGVTRAHLSRILNGHAGVTASMSLRLSAALGTSGLRCSCSATSGWLRKGACRRCVRSHVSLPRDGRQCSWMGSQQLLALPVDKYSLCNSSAVCCTSLPCPIGMRLSFAFHPTICETCFISIATEN